MLPAGFHPSRRIARRGNRFLLKVNLWPLVGILIILIVLLFAVVLPERVL
jgi:hypothetical protein